MIHGHHGMEEFWKVGQYHPIEAENQIVLDAEKIKAWIAKGALPSQTVKKLLNKQNIAVK